MRSEADLPPAADGEEAALERVVGHEPSPAFAAQMPEECGRLFEALGDDELRDVARWKREGHTNAKVGARLGCIERTGERKPRTIRDL